MVETPSIPPSSASSPRVTSASAGAAGVGQQPTTQPAVSIASGSVLSGTVTAADAKGNITLETAAVKLVLQSSVALPRNAQVTVRVEQPVTSDSMPTVRILTVDGKPVSQYIQQAAGQNPQHPGEVARPTAQVIEMSARPTTATQPDAAVQAAVSNRAVAASQLSITAAQTLPAVLLRPMVTARTEEILTKLTQPLLDAAGKPLPQAAPPLTPAMLRPGMQLQVRIMEMPQAMPTGAAPAAPVSAPNAAITPVQPVAAQPIPSQPTGVQTPVNSAQPQQSAGVPTTPNPAQTIVDTVAQKAAYAIYAKQPAVILHPTDSPAKPTVLPAGTPAQTPTPQTPVAQQVAVPSSTPQPQTTQPTVPQPQPMPAPTATTPQATATPTPAQNMSAPTVALSPKVVENLLTTAEGKGLPAGQMAAVVVSTPQSGVVTVQTRLGLFSIPTPQIQSPHTTIPAQTSTAIQPGTVITWQVRQVLPSVQPPLPMDAAVPLVSALQVGRAGSAFHELLGVIQTLQGNHAPQTLSRLIPQIGAGLSAGILLFMSVVKKGDVASWLGRELHDSIESAGRGDLLQRLGGELNALRSLFGGAEQQQPNSWQAMFLPIMVGKDLETAQLFVKPDDKGNKEGGGGGQRFVLELDLSAFGPMQMDGLFKRQEGQNQFNLVIRTLDALPEEVKTDIYSIFESSQKATGLTGGVTFRTVPEFPVNPLEEMQSEQRGDGSILA